MPAAVRLDMTWIGENCLVTMKDRDVALRVSAGRHSMDQSWVTQQFQQANSACE